MSPSAWHRGTSMRAAKAAWLPRNGGEWKEEIPEGYYVDFTTIAMDYGWERRNALSNWRSSYFDIEWWHFQKTEGMKLVRVHDRAVPRGRGHRLLRIPPLVDQAPRVGGPAALVTPGSLRLAPPSPQHAQALPVDSSPGAPPRQATPHPHRPPADQSTGYTAPAPSRGSPPTSGRCSPDQPPHWRKLGRAPHADKPPPHPAPPTRGSIHGLHGSRPVNGAHRPPTSGSLIHQAEVSVPRSIHRRATHAPRTHPPHQRPSQRPNLREPDSSGESPVARSIHRRATHASRTHPPHQRPSQCPNLREPDSSGGSPVARSIHRFRPPRWGHPRTPTHSAGGGDPRPRRAESRCRRPSPPPRPPAPLAL